MQLTQSLNRFWLPEVNIPLQLNLSSQFENSQRSYKNITIIILIQTQPFLLFWQYDIFLEMVSDVVGPTYLYV